MNQAKDMLGGIDLGGIIVIAAIIVAALLFFLIKKGFAHAQIKERLDILAATKAYESAIIEKAKAEGKEIKPSILGTGDFKCLAIKPGNIIDWTTIPAPIGEMYQADTSCPVSGSIYIVRETEEGKVVDYDPREVPVIIQQTPEWAWYATHWDIVRKVFSIPLSWWKSTSLWFAAAMVVVMFIFGMASLGG